MSNMVVYKVTTGLLSVGIGRGNCYCLRHKFFKSMTQVLHSHSHTVSIHVQKGFVTCTMTF